MKLLKQTIKNFFTLIRKRPDILTPFLLVFFTEGIILYIIYLFPQRPVSYILAPPIRIFFGEKFLHYPFNLYLIPKLFYYARMLIATTLGVVMTASAIYMIKSIEAEEPKGFLSSIWASLKKFLPLLSIWLIVYGTTWGAMKLTSPIASSKFLIFGVTVFIQTIFIYAIPILILENRNFIFAIWRSLSFFKKLFFPTLFLILIPILFYFPVLILENKASFLMNRLFPEIVLGVIILSITVSFIIDTFVSIISTLLALEKIKKG